MSGNQSESARGKKRPLEEKENDQKKLSLLSQIKKIAEDPSWCPDITEQQEYDEAIRVILEAAREKKDRAVVNLTYPDNIKRLQEEGIFVTVDSENNEKHVFFSLDGTPLKVRKRHISSFSWRQLSESNIIATRLYWSGNYDALPHPCSEIDESTYNDLINSSFYVWTVDKERKLDV